MYVYQTKLICFCAAVFCYHPYFLFLLITMKGVYNAKRSAISFKQFVPLVLTYMGNTCDYILIIHKFINAGD